MIWARAAHEAHASILLREPMRLNGTAGNDLIGLLRPEGLEVIA